MQTQTKMKTMNLEANLGQLPILKHLSQESLTAKVDTFRKGEKGLFWFIKLALFGAAGYLTWVYVLPPLLQYVGVTLGIISSILLVIFTFIAMPAILKWMRTMTRAIHKAAVAYDPFGQLAIERQKYVESQNTVRVSKTNIGLLKEDMENEAYKSEAEAKEGQDEIIRLQGKAERLKAEMSNMISEKGDEAKSEDAYVELASNLQKTLADFQRVSNKLTQAKNYISKYGSRAQIMKTVAQQLTMAETAIEIKIGDFDASVEMLKKDFAFGQKANAATTAAKTALGLDKSWELDVALDVIQSAISADIASTSANFKDIQSLTTNYTLDSDELFDNLNQVAEKIKLGNDVIPNAKKYSNPEYKLTSDDKRKSGGFGQLFD